MSYNVPVVYDVFAVAIKELRSNSSDRKNVAKKKPTKGKARLGFFVARAAERRRSIYNPVEVAEKVHNTSLFILTT